MINRWRRLDQKGMSAGDVWGWRESKREDMGGGGVAKEEWKREGRTEMGRRER